MSPEASVVNIAIVVSCIRGVLSVLVKIYGRVLGRLGAVASCC